MFKTPKSESESPEIPRLNPPAQGESIQGWCLYLDDHWDGPVPKDWDEKGWIVYPDRVTAYLGLARELRRRCELFDAGELPGEQLACTWYPVEVGYLSDGCVRDISGAEFKPGQPW